MKKIILVVCIIVTSTISAQSGKVIYEVNMGDTPTVSLEILTPYLEKAKENISQIKFDLQFNDNESLFSVQQLKGIDEKKLLYIVKPFIAYIGEVYQSGSTSYTLVDDLLDKTYLIKRSSDLNWKITEETKTINGYLCYKATLDETHQYNGKTFPRTTLAWFCPKLPYSFGPNGYRNLPGLILELQNFKCSYVAKKITLKKHQKQIHKPKGIEISEEEFDNKLMETFSD